MILRDVTQQNCTPYDVPSPPVFGQALPVGSLHSPWHTGTWWEGGGRKEEGRKDEGRRGRGAGRK